MNEKQPITAERVQAEYEKGVQYNTGLGLYEDVKQCENDSGKASRARTYGRSR